MMRRALVVLMLLTSAASMNAASTYRVKDINSTPTPGSSYPTNFITSGSYAYFTTGDSHGVPAALWRTDGTASGTIALGATHEPAVSWNGRVWFCRKSGSVSELWSTDGTVAGTTKVTSPNADLSVSYLMAGGNRLYFTSGGFLWQTDGTTAGTVKTSDINLFFGDPITATAPISTYAGSTFYFIAHDGIALRLWRSDVNGTVAIGDGDAGSLASLRLVGNTIFFFSSPASAGGRWILWRTDGTYGGTWKLKTSAPILSNSPNFAAIGSDVYFTGDDGSGAKLWRTDGTDAGTVAVATSLPGSSSTFAADPLGAVGTRVLFQGPANPPSAPNTSPNIGIWSWDGTNTTFLTNVVAGNVSRSLTAADTYGVFGASPNVYRTDGTIGGTYQLRNLGGVSLPILWPMTALGSSVVFGADGGDGNGFELWKTDGSVANTGFLKDVGSSTWNSYPQLLRAFNDGVLFTASSNNVSSAPDGGNRDLWFSDGTEAGTRRILADFGYGFELVPCGSRAYFTRSDAETGAELWSTDGTTASLVKDILPGTAYDLPRGSNPRTLRCVDGKLFFQAYSHATGSVEVWRSDGTAAGTVQVREFAAPPYALPTLLLLTKFQHGLLIGLRDAGSATGLWASDGTPAGTSFVRSLSLSDYNPPVVAAGNYVWFNALDPGNGFKLFRSNATPGGTTAMLSDSVSVLSAYGSRIAFYAPALCGGLCTSDGSSTWRFDTMNTLRSRFGMRELNGRLFYNLPQLRSTDGTSPGISAGAGDAEALLEVAGGRLYFLRFGTTATIVETDGTAAGTQTIAGEHRDITATVASGGRLFVAAEELYAYDLPVTAVSFAPRSVGVAGGAAVTISGRGFIMPAAVTVGDVPATVTASSATSITFTAPPNAAGTYDIALTLGDGRRLTLETPLAYVCTAPVATVSASPAAVCPLTPVTLQGGGGARCVWFPSTGLDNASSCSPVATAAETTTYSLLVYNEAGCASTNYPSITVTVLPQPVADISVQGLSAGDNAAFDSTYTATVTDAGAGATYSWVGEGVQITSGSTSSAVTFKTGCARAFLNATVTNAAGCSTTTRRQIYFLGAMTANVPSVLLNPGSTFSATGQGLQCLASVWLGDASVPFTVNGSSLTMRCPAGAPASGPLHLVAPAVDVYGYGLVYTTRRDDFRGDNSADVVWRNATTGEALIWSISDGNALTSVSIRPAGATDYTLEASGEFGDTKAMSDLLWRRTSGELVMQFWYAGLPWTERVWPALPATTIVAGAGDLSGDGIAEVVMRDTQTGATSQYKLNSNGTYTQTPIHRGGNLTWDVIGVRDFDGDGKADILWREKNTGQTIVWLMNGATISSSLVVHGGGNTGFDIAGLGDFDGDTKTDILWRERSSGMLILWLMNGSAISQSLVVHYGGNQNWTVAQIGDFTGDGKADVLWREKNTGQTLYWPMNGAQIQSTVLLHPGGNSGWNIENPK